VRILPDSNVLISATLFKTEAMTAFVDKIKNDFTIVFTNLIIDESTAVIARKFPERVGVFKQFLSELSFEYRYVPDDTADFDYDIRDEFDKRFYIPHICRQRTCL
jgi:predicted nucleic acid-binding protein